MTCFDRLGQPANWLDFGPWLESSDCEDERNTILQEASQAASLNESIKIAYRRYKALYGLKSSFFRFLREILPRDVRGELLNSIERSITTNAPKLKGRQATDKEKEEYLLDRRNVFTHKAGFTPPPGEWFGGGVTNYVQEFHATYWTSTNTLGWPDILEKAVHVGLACYLRASSKNSPDLAPR